MNIIFKAKNIVKLKKKTLRFNNNLTLKSLPNLYLTSSLNSF